MPQDPAPRTLERPAAGSSRRQSYDVDVVAQHFRSKGFEASKMVGALGKVAVLVLSRRGKQEMVFVVKNNAIRLAHLRAVVKDYASQRRG